MSPGLSSLCKNISSLFPRPSHHTLPHFFPTFRIRLCVSLSLRPLIFLRTSSRVIITWETRDRTRLAGSFDLKVSWCDVWWCVTGDATTRGGGTRVRRKDWVPTSGKVRFTACKVGARIFHPRFQAMLPFCVRGGAWPPSSPLQAPYPPLHPHPIPSLPKWRQKLITLLPLRKSQTLPLPSLVLRVWEKVVDVVGETRNYKCSRHYVTFKGHWSSLQAFLSFDVTFDRFQLLFSITWLIEFVFLSRPDIRHRSM